MDKNVGLCPFISSNLVQLLFTIISAKDQFRFTKYVELRLSPTQKVYGAKIFVAKFFAVQILIAH